MSKRVNLFGQRFGKLVVAGAGGSDGLNRLWACRCDCGNDTLRSTRYLTRSDVPSCGCVRRELMASFAQRAAAASAKARGERAAQRSGRRACGAYVDLAAALGYPTRVIQPTKARAVVRWDEQGEM